MAPVSIKIILDDGAVTRKVKIDPRATVAEAHKIVKDKVVVSEKEKEYGLFLRSADNDLSGVWLEKDRTLDYYMLRDGDSLDYICKIRNLRIKMLDDTVKTLQVDQSKPVGELMHGICARIGITNYDEYGLCLDEEDEQEECKDAKNAASTGTLTMKHKAPQKELDTELEELSKKVETDDDVQWLDHHKTLREMNVDPKETLLLKRRLYYSDRNVDSRDPVQLNLLYLQTRDAILHRIHLVTEEQAADCKVRWINIRDVHRRIYRKRLSEPNNFFKPYKYEKEVSFMKAYYKDGTVPLKLTDCDDDEKNYENWNDNIVDNEPEMDDTDESEEPIKKAIVKRRKSKKRKERSYEEEEKADVTNFVDATPSEYDPADPVDAFLLSIGATLKTFTPYHLNLAKSKIFSVVQEHDLQQIMQKQSHDVKMSTSEVLYLNE